MSFIDKIGVELEGAWDNEPDNYYGDGSVEFDNDCSCDSDPCECDSQYNFIGECSGRGVSLSEISDWVRNNYPNETNWSCGMHVHVSFLSDQHYTILTDKKFYKYFLERMNDFGKRLNIKNKDFWKRLRGTNTYCQNKFIPDNQLITNCDERYTHLNFCFGEHRTIECRLLPCFRDVDISIRAIEELIDIYESWLKRKYVSLKPIKKRVIV